jgi:protein pelota
MRILKKDLRSGEVKVLMQSQDDLWHLSNILEPGDTVIATTFRRETKIEGKLRAERMEKKKVRLKIAVEEVGFQEFTDRLRIHGTIAEGEEAGSHHTLMLGVEDDLSIIKEKWRQHELERLDDAVKSSYAPIITFLAFEYDEAVLAQLYQYGVKEVATIRPKSTGKQYESKPTREEFYGEIMAKLKVMEVGDALIIVGPGFAKDDLVKHLREKRYDKKFHVCSSAQGGMLGIHEVLKGGIAKVLEEHRVVFESQLVEEFLSEIAKDGPVTYGPDEVKRALEMGAVEKLLISTDKMREKGIEPILELAEKTRAKLTSISPHHDAGRKLKKMGGLGALLRYRI